MYSTCNYTGMIQSKMKPSAPVSITYCTVLRFPSVVRVAVQTRKLTFVFLSPARNINWQNSLRTKCTVCKQYSLHISVMPASQMPFCESFVRHLYKIPKVVSSKKCLLGTCVLRVTPIMQLFLSVKLTITFERSITVQEALTCDLCFFAPYTLTFCSKPYSPGLRIRIHLIRIRIQHFRLNTDPDPGVLMTKNCKKFTAEIS